MPAASAAAADQGTAVPAAVTGGKEIAEAALTSLTSDWRMHHRSATDFHCTPATAQQREKEGRSELLLLLLASGKEGRGREGGRIVREKHSSLFYTFYSKKPFLFFSQTPAHTHTHTRDLIVFVTHILSLMLLYVCSLLFIIHSFFPLTHSCV